MMIGIRTRDASAAPMKPTVAMTPTSNMMDVVAITRKASRRAERGRSRLSRENRGSHPVGASNLFLQKAVVNARRMPQSRVPTDVRDEVYYASEGSAHDGRRLAFLAGRRRPPAS